MAKTNTFHCDVITPERVVLDCDARFVAFTAHDGEMGVLVNRAPLVCKLGIGMLRVETPSDKHVMFLDGGFAQVVDNRLTILTQQAKKVGEIQRAVAEKSLADARSMKVTGDATRIARENAVRRAEVQLKLLR